MDDVITCCDVCLKKLESGELKTLQPLVYDPATGGGRCPHCDKYFFGNDFPKVG